MYRYHPTTKKALFNKKTVNELDDVLNNLAPSQIVCVVGPVGCGKSATLKVLLKSFCVHTVETDSIRTTPPDIQYPCFRGHTIESTKLNVLLIENIEPAEKNMTMFIETIRIHSDIPVIVTMNNPKLIELFKHGCRTVVSFEKPSFKELDGFVKEVFLVNQIEQVSTEEIITRANYDVRQLYFILDNLKIHCIVHRGVPFDLNHFLESTFAKELELDTPDRIRMVMDSKVSFKCNELIDVCLSDPTCISNSIFSNYLNSNTSLETMSDVIDDLSSGAVLNGQIFANQWWYLYDSYTVASCVSPGFHLKEARGSVPDTLIPFKDVSMNYATSLGEVRKVSSNNWNELVKRNCAVINTETVLRDPQMCMYIAGVVRTLVKSVSGYFEVSKKGKNTSKKEKVLQTEQLLEKETLQRDHFNLLADIVYSLALFEINGTYQKEESIDLRIFKRFVNIFNIHTVQIKSYIEVALEFALLKRIKDNGSKGQQNIESLEIDLDQIWI